LFGFRLLEGKEFCKGLGLCFAFFVCMDYVERLLEFFIK